MAEGAPTPTGVTGTAWPGPSPPLVDSPKNIIGNGQKTREAVEVAQGHRVPIDYGYLKAGYDLVYLNASAVKYAADDNQYPGESIFLTAVGVVSEGPVDEFTGYTDNTTGQSYTMSQVGTYTVDGTTRYRPVWDLYAIRNGIPDPDVAVVPAAASTGTWGYSVAYCYWGYEMPFGVFPEVRIINGHANTPNNTISWTPPLDEDGYPLCGGVIIYRTYSANAGSYPVGPIGFISYGHTQNPGTYQFVDNAVALLTAPPDGPPVTPPTGTPCGLMPNTSFIVAQWIRLNGTYTRFPRMLVKGKRMIDPRLAISGTFADDSLVISSITDTSRVKVGQKIYGTLIPAGAWVTNVTSNSVTLSVLPTADGVANFYINDTFSLNPALEMLDLKLNEDFGDSVHISEIDLASITTAANRCEETVNYTDENGDAATRARHECSLQIREVAPAEDWQKTIGLHGHLRWQRKGGQYVLLAWKPGSVVRDMGEDDLCEPPTLRRTAFAGLSDLPNRVSVEWTDRSVNGAWRVRAEYAQTDEVDAGAEIREGSAFQLHGIQNQHEAAQSVMVLLNTITGDLTISARVMPEHEDLAVGDIVSFTYGPMGMSAVTFFITGRDINPDDSITLTGREYHDETFTQQDPPLFRMKMAFHGVVADEYFSDDFLTTASRDWIDVSQTVTTTTRTTVTDYTAAFQYSLPDVPSAYKHIEARYYDGPAAQAGWNTTPYFDMTFNVTGIDKTKSNWSAPITADYAVYGPGGPWKTVTVVETFGSDGVTVISAETTTVERARTVIWKLVSADDEVSVSDPDTGYSFYLATDSSSTSTSTVQAPLVYKITGGIEGAPYNGKWTPTLWWDRPDSTFERWSSGWTASIGATINSQSEINDGLLGTSVPAPVVFSGASKNNLTLDLGSGVTREFTKVRIATRRVDYSPPLIEPDGVSNSLYYSDNGSTFTLFTGTLYSGLQPSSIGGAVAYDITLYEWATVGSHRYWRIYKDVDSNGLDLPIEEVQWLVGDTAYPSKIDYVLRRGPDPGGTILTVIPDALIPTEANPLSVGKYAEQIAENATFTTNVLDVWVSAINRDDTEGTETVTGRVLVTFESDQDTEYAMRQNNAFPGVVQSGSVGMAGSIVSETDVTVPSVVLMEDPINGTDYVEIKAPVSISAAYTITMPSDPPTNNDILLVQADGSSMWVEKPSTSGGGISNAKGYFFGGM